MTIDSIMIDSLWAWARLQAPLNFDSDCDPPRHRVRLEINAEQPSEQLFGNGTVLWPERIVARVYLAEPRCKCAIGYPAGFIAPCECGPLAETRIA